MTARYHMHGFYVYSMYFYVYSRSGSRDRIVQLTLDGHILPYVTYVTYVEFRPDLTGPSAIPTTPERCKSLLLSPAQQRVRVWRSVSPDRRFIRDG